MRVYLWKHFPSKELFYLDIGHGFVYFFSRVGFWCLFANWWVSLQRSDNKSSSFVLSILKNRTIPSSLGGFEHANDERAWSYFPLFGVLSLIDVVCFVLQWTGNWSGVAWRSVDQSKSSTTSRRLIPRHWECKTSRRLFQMQDYLVHVTFSTCAWRQGVCERCFWNIFSWHDSGESFLSVLTRFTKRNLVEMLGISMCGLISFQVMNYFNSEQSSATPNQNA